MKTLKDKVVAVTGAGSGISRATAMEGCRLAPADIHEHGLSETGIQCRRFKVNAIGTVLNVAERNTVHEWARVTRQTCCKVNVNINNAGVSLTGAAEDIGYTDYEWRMNINVWGVVYSTRAFLPCSEQSIEVYIVNVSSLFGIIAFHTSCADNASKFTIHGFTESLRIQLEVENIPIKVTCAYPGGGATGIVHSGHVVRNER